MNILLNKFKEVVISVAPIIVFVLILHFTFLPLEMPQLIRFIIGATLIIIGMSIFLFGVDIFVTPLGEMSGQALAKSNKVAIISTAGLLLGFFISVAEPALHILAGQVSKVSLNQIGFWDLIIAVSIGMAIMISIGLIRSIFSFSFKITMFICYFVIFILCLFTPMEYLVIAFDSSGATTGAMAVPFLLSLSYGVGKMKKKGHSSNEDSFGLVAIASAGAIMGVLILGLVSNVKSFSGELGESINYSSKVFEPFIKELPVQTINVLVSLAPLVATFVLFQFIFFKLKKRAVKRIIKGILYTTFGLILFLLGVNAGFMEVGKAVGTNIANLNIDWLIIVLGFFLGFMIIMAEPAVYVLTKQIGDVTSGSIKRLSVVLTLGIGVGIAVTLASTRVVFPQVQLWYYLLPGYIIALGMMPFVSSLFVGIAYDSGGVASGPMIGTFIFAFIQGVAQAKGVNLITNGFGMIAMVAFTPLVALQILGLIYKFKSRKGGLEHANE